MEAPQTRPADWKELYQLALVEPDPRNLGRRVTDARQAIYARINATLTAPNNSEHQQMNDALSALHTLQMEYERRIQRFGEKRAAGL